MDDRDPVGKPLSFEKAVRRVVADECDDARATLEELFDKPSTEKTGNTSDEDVALPPVIVSNGHQQAPTTIGMWANGVPCE